MTKQTVCSIIAVFFGLSISVSVLANTKTNTFIDNGNGSVTDTATGLIWQQQDDDVERNHAEAIMYCQNLDLAGSTNWRLPNIKELMSIVDYRIDKPSIDDAMFPETNSANYWSVSSRASFPDTAWLVFFVNGTAFANVKTITVYVRCVR